MRNRDRCPCGSGKRWAACCRDRKPREYGISFTVPKTTKIDGVVFDRTRGMLWPALGGVPVDLAEAHAEIGYDRPKGRKVLVRAPTNPSEPIIDPNAAVFGDHVVLGVDTNTRVIAGRTVSVGCAVQLVWYRRPEDGKAVIRGLSPALAIEIHDPLLDPERLAWREVCLRLSATPGTEQRRFLLVVDSSLGQLDAVNRGEIPVVGDYRLPENVTLSYASADATNTAVANRIITACDKFASGLLDHIEQVPPPPRATAKEGPWSFIAYRSWTPQGLIPFDSSK